MATTISFKDKLIYILLLACIFTTMYCYMPSVYASPGSYAVLRMFNIGVIAVMFLFTGKFGQLISHAFLSKFLFSISGMFVVLLIIQFLNLRVDYASTIVLLNSLIAMWIGYQTKLGAKNLKLLLVFHAIIAIILGYGAITTYLGNFSLESDLYLLDGKNQIGVHVAVATFAMLYLAMMTNVKKEKTFAYILFAILISMLVIIRCRTAL